MNIHETNCSPCSPCTNLFYSVLKFEQQKTKENSTSTITSMISDFPVLNYSMFVVLIFNSVDFPVTALFIQEDDVLK